MAQEKVNNYSVSKETALLLDAIKKMDQAWELVMESIMIKRKKDNYDEIRDYVVNFDGHFDNAKEFVIGEIEDNLRNYISMENFKVI